MTWRYKPKHYQKRVKCGVVEMNNDVQAYAISKFLNICYAIKFLKSLKPSFMISYVIVGRLWSPRVPKFLKLFYIRVFC